MRFPPVFTWANRRGWVLGLGIEKPAYGSLDTAVPSPRKVNLLMRRNVFLVTFVSELPLVNSEEGVTVLDDGAIV